MKIYKIDCPRCGATMNLDPENRIAFCPYCGAKLPAYDENEYTYNYNEHVTHEYNETKTQRIVDEAQIEYEKNKVEYARQNRLKETAEAIAAVILGLGALYFLAYIMTHM